MIFKEGDEIEYPNGLCCIIKTVIDGYVYLYTFDGMITLVERGLLLNGIASGRLKFKNYGKELHPIKHLGEHTL